MGTLRLPFSSFATSVKTLILACALLCVHVVEAQILQRGAATTNSIGSASASMTINKPTGVVSGDVMIASVLQNETDNDNGGLSNVTATGWTLVDGRTIFSQGTANGNNAWYGTVLYRVADGTEGSSFSFTLPNSRADMAIGSIVAFSGVTSTLGVKADGTAGGPFDIDPGTLNVPSASTTATATSVTTASANSAVIMLSMVNSNVTYSGWAATNPSSLTELYDNLTTSADRGAVAASWAIRSTAGATGNGTVTLSGSSTSGSMFLVLKSCAPIIATPATPAALCAGGIYNPSAPTVTNNGSTITSQGWQIETAVGSNSFTSLTVPYTVAVADNGKDILYTATNACGTSNSANVTLTVNANNTITLSSAAGTNAQSRCINQAITAISYATTGATGATVSGLPAGVSGSWVADVFTISGTPSVSGTFNYTVTMTGGCTGGTNTASGSIVVNPNNTIALSSAIGTNAQTRCINNAITSITYATTGATGATVSGLPTGVTGSWAANVFTISGTPSVSGTFNYTVTMTGGCTGGTNTASGSIVVNPNNTIALSSAIGTDAQTRCINNAITSITYATTGATGATVSGLPTGVTGSWAANVFTISGTPSVSGTFNYTVTMTGGCTGGTNTASGSIVVNPNNTIGLTSIAGTNAQTRCINNAIANITYATTGATGATVSGLPAGVSGSWASNVVTISGTPAASGTFNYTVTMIGGCTGGTNTASGSIVVNPNNAITLSSGAGTDSLTVCHNTAMPAITYTTTGATGATFSGLPTGVSGSWATNTVTISGTPSVTGTFNYTVTITGGCTAGTNTTSGVITVIEIDPIYSHNFSDLANTNTTYTTSPLYTSPAGVFNDGLSSSSWSATSGGAATTFSRVSNVNGSGNNVIAFNPGQNQTSSLILTFIVNPGYTASINAFNFWRLRQQSSAPSISSITINGITVFAGENSPISGALLGNTCVMNAVDNLSGTVTVEINLTASSLSSGQRWFYLDDFTLFGTVSSPSPYSQVYLHNFNDNPTGSPYNTSPTATTGVPAGIFNSNFVANSSSWVSSTGNLTFTADGSGGDELALLTPANATSTLTLTFNVACGYVLDIDAFNFYQQRQTTLCSNISSMTINGTTVYGGSTASTSGSNIGVTGVATAMDNLAGTVTIVINLTASNETTGNRYFYLDEFTLYGSLTATSTTPAQPAAIAGTATNCPAITGQTYSIDPVTYATTYNWTVPTGWTITAGAGTTSITVTTGAAGQNGNISVTAQNSCATSAARTFAVTVSPGTPAQPSSISGTAAQCAAATGQTYSVTAVPNATTYNWSLPTGWSITAGAGTNSITVTSGAVGQNGNISVTAQNSCGTSAARTLAVTVNLGTPAQPGVISGTTALCPAVTGQTYSITAVTNATTYNWSVPTGWSITAGAGTTSITVTSGAAGQNGNISVTAQNNCGTSSARTFAVTVNPGTPAQPGVISGTAAQCPAVTGQTYSISAVTNATTYNWTVPAGWSITAGAGTNAITVTAGAAGQNGNISVTAQNSCGTSAVRTFAVTVNPGTPAQPSVISGTAAQCPAVTGQTYSISAVTNATTYNWSVPTGWAITAGAGTNSITVTSGAAGQNGNISVTAQNSCGTSAARTLAVTVNPGTPAQPGVISGTAAQCPALSSQTYSVAAVTNATSYNWSAPTGWSITAGAGTNSITVTTGAAGQNGNISVTAQNSCGTSSAAALSVIVNSRPTAALSGDAQICAGNSSALSIALTGSGPWNGTLSDGQAFTASSSPAVISVTPVANTTYSISNLSDANCPAIGGLTGSAAIVVNALPTASITGSATICGGNSGSVSITGPANGLVAYSLNGVEQNTALNASGNAVINTGAVWQNLNYQLVEVEDGLCESYPTGTATITYQESPDATITGSTQLCSGQSTTIAFNGNPNGVVTYNVNGGASQNVTLNGSGSATVNTGALSASTTYNLVSVAVGTCSSTIGTSAVVNVGLTIYYQDNDGDGYGNAAVSTVACSQPAGYVTVAGDCCDTNADISPICEWWGDMDGDGYGSFIFEVGCISGVSCSSATWPAQLIPYCPLAHDGVLYAADCNDNSVAVNPGVTEVCNNTIDDDCDGFIGEACSGQLFDQWASAQLLNVNTTNAYYPNCQTYGGTLVNTDVSPQANPANVAAGAGRDVWYRFVAPTTGVRIQVTASGFNPVIELRTAAHPAGQVDVENANPAVGGTEILNFGNLTVGQTYYVGVRNHDATNVGTYTICVSPLRVSGCATSVPLGGLSLCNSFKVLYTAATSYTMSFSGVGGNANGVNTSLTSLTGLVPMSNSSLALRYGGIYNVQVDANYALTNGLGQADGIFTVLGNSAPANCQNIAIMQQPLVEVRNTQICPIVLARVSSLLANPVAGSSNVCGVINYTYEFTRVSDCLGTTVIGSAFTVNTTGNAASLALNTAFPTQLGSTGYWSVRVRPNFSGSYQGAWGPAKVIAVSGSAASQMLDEEQGAQAVKTFAAQPLSVVYPNPNNGSEVNINLTDIGSGDLAVKIVDALGRTIYTNRFAVDGSLFTKIDFAEQLTGGIYLVEFTINGETMNERMVVER